jgi:CDGSH-type Zn-finger protein
MKQEPVALFSHGVVDPSSPNKPRPCIRLSRNGPYLVTVDDLTNSKGERLQGWNGVALCRCGASRKKPFCDSSHIRIGFSDDRCPDRTPDGVVANRDAAQPGPSDANAPSIRIARNGPYEVQGFDLDTDNWSEGASRERYFLCRCGGSKNKPFCDGTHRSIQFQDDRN